MIDTPDRINSAVARQLAGGVSGTTLMRWAKLGIIPQPIVIRGRNYWSRSQLVAALKAANENPESAV